MQKIIDLELPGFNSTIHPTVLMDETNLVLVDCGYMGYLPQIENALRQHHIEPENLTHVVITHQDYDHIGALADLCEKYPKVQVVASALEAPYIQGERKFLRLQQAENLQEQLPQEKQAEGEAFCKMLRSVQPAHVDVPVHGGEVFDWCGGCEVIATPGHMPGHISLFLKKYRTIITGDAAVAENGVLGHANPQYTLDMPSAEASLQKLLALPADTFICYHGGMVAHP